MGSLKKPGTLVWFWCFLALWLGHLAIIIASPHPPSLQDYPDWVYQGVLFAKLVSGHSVPGYVLKHYPVPNSLTTVGVGALTLLMGWQLAAKVWLVLVFLALGAACVRLLHALGGESQAVLPVFACSVLAGIDFWNGSVNFQMSLAWMLLLLAHLLQQRNRPWAIGLLLLLCFFTHMLPCGAGLLALLALAVQERDWRRLLPAIPTVLLAGCYSLMRDRAESQQSPLHLVPAALAAGLVFWWAARAPISHRKAAGRATLMVIWPLPLLVLAVLAASKLLALLGWIGPIEVIPSGAGAGRVLWPLPLFLGFCMVGLCAAGLGAWTLGKSWLGMARTADPRRFLAMTALTLTTLFVFSPADALGVTPIDSRFLHLAIACGLGLLGLRGSRRLTILAALATLVGAINLAQFAAVQFQPTTVSVLSGLEFLPGSSPAAPAVRLPYYRALEAGRYNTWIFPTALFRWKPQ